jgi:hypothetical protein
LVNLLVFQAYTGCPTTYQTRQFFNNFTTNKDIAQQLGAHYRHIPVHFSPTNVLLFKSRCNILIGFGIIKELSGLVGSGTPYINEMYGSRSKIPSNKSRQSALRGGI